MRTISLRKISFILIFFALISIVIFNYTNTSDLVFFIQLEFLLFLCCFPFYLEKKVEFYNPIILISVVYFINFGLGSIYIHSYPELFYYNIDSVILISGLYFINACFLSFLFGYYALNYNKLIRRIIGRIISITPNIKKIDIAITKLPILLLILLLVGWFSRFLILKLGAYYHLEAGQSVLATEYSKITQFVIIGSLFPLIALCITFLKYLENRRRTFLLIFSILLLISEIVYSLPTGSKEEVLLPIFIILVLYSIQRGTPIKVLLLSFTIGILFIFPLVNIFRMGLASTGGSIYYNLIEAFNLYWDSFLLYDYFFLEDILFSVFGMRLNYAHIVSVLVGDTPDVWSFKYGYTYALFFISLIPRILWTSKPEIAYIGNDFGRDYGFLASNDYTTSVGMNWIGEIFINFGWYGLFIAFLYGLIYRFIYVYFFWNSKPNTLGSVFYAFALYTIIRGDMFAGQFSGLIKYYIVLVIIFIPFIKKFPKKNNQEAY